MATLTVRKLDEAIVRALRIRAAEHGRSAEAEHREILQSALAAAAQPSTREAVFARLAAFRERTAGRGSQGAVELLEESRMHRCGEVPDGEDG